MQRNGCGMFSDVYTIPFYIAAMGVVSAGGMPCPETEVVLFCLTHFREGI